MYATAKKYVEVGAKPIQEYGYLSTVEVIDVPNGHELMGAEYETDACARVEEWGDLCYIEPVKPCDGAAVTPPVGGFKVFERGRYLVEGDPFVLQHGTECAAIGMSDESAMTHSDAGFDYGESLGVDLTMNNLIDPQATQIAGEFSIRTGFGLLIDAASTFTGAVATIITSRSVALMAYGLGIVEKQSDGRLVTPFGNPVVAYGSSILLTPDHAHPSYVTGPITILRGPKESKIAPELVLPDLTCEPRRALTERMYVPLIECGVGYRADILLDDPVATP